MGHNIPNLDGMTPDELREASDAFRMLSLYASNKARAMRERVNGNITSALSIEHACDRIYQTLPRSYRW